MDDTDCITGLDGWMFLGTRHQFEAQQAIGRRQPPAGLPEQWARTLGLMRDCCRRQGADFMPIIVPSKASIYADKLPVPAAERAPDLSPMSRIIAAAAGEGLDLIDLRPGLVAARAQADTYSRLNSHWTDFGGWVGWTLVAERLRRLPRPIDLRSDLRVLEVVEQDTGNEMLKLVGLEGFNNWTRPTFDLTLPNVTYVGPDGACSPQNGLWTVDMLAMPLDVRNEAAANPMACLVLGDSTTTALSPFINLHFAQVAYRNHHIAAQDRCSELSDHLAETRPAIVFYVTTERYCLLPLHEPDHWEALQLFETADPAARYAWPARWPDLPIRCAGGPHLGPPNLIQLPVRPPGERFAARITVASEGEGLVMSAFATGGMPHQKWHKVRAGLNHLYLDLPAPTDGNHLWLVRDATREPVMLAAVSLRAYRPAETGAAALATASSPPRRTRSGGPMRS